MTPKGFPNGAGLDCNHDGDLTDAGRFCFSRIERTRQILASDIAQRLMHQSVSIAGVRE